MNPKQYLEEITGNKWNSMYDIFDGSSSIHDTLFSFGNKFNNKIEPILKSKGIEYKLHSSSSGVTIEVNPIKIIQMIRNDKLNNLLNT